MEIILTHLSAIPKSTRVISCWEDLLQCELSRNFFLDPSRANHESRNEVPPRSTFFAKFKVMGSFPEQAYILQGIPGRKLPPKGEKKD